MKRIVVTKTANGGDMVQIRGPNTVIYCHPAELQPLSPAERQSIAKSAELQKRNEELTEVLDDWNFHLTAKHYEDLHIVPSADDADVRQQFDEGSREMFGNASPPADQNANGVLDGAFTNTPEPFDMLGLLMTESEGDE